jgi:hypothetical protein
MKEKASVVKLFYMEAAHRWLEDGEENQVKRFTGVGLPAGFKPWSKAGWTSNT